MRKRYGKANGGSDPRRDPVQSAAVCPAAVSGAAVSTALTAAINWVFALYYGRKFVRIEIKFSKHIGMFFC